MNSNTPTLTPLSPASACLREAASAKAGEMVNIIFIVSEGDEPFM